MQHATNVAAVFHTIIERPLLIFVVSFLTLWAATIVGALCGRRVPAPDANRQDTLKVVMGATLTLLGLVIGFSFSMAVSRYDQRKIYEEDEANAIGTELLRIELLPSAAGTTDLLKAYLAQRTLFYEARDNRDLAEIAARTSALQGRLWAAVREAAAAQPTPVVALATAGMNDVLNSQGYTQAAWSNRIPGGAWLLMCVIGVLSCLLAGYTSRAARPLVMLPVVLAVAFFFISDIDSPRHGVIRVVPQNLVSLSDSLRPR
ncbi:MAG TPA: hypothetical protein VLV86_15765 [Vicinamibacterales bacterium]|nr:hypothetical protein [Vicinamibacterales bacterium]